MASDSAYALLDFGRGRKLERFGDVVLDRPCPAAERTTPRQPELWESATARFVKTDGEEGSWTPARQLPADWQLEVPLGQQEEAGDQRLVFELSATPFGHVGVFAEQAPNWVWICRRLRRVDRALRILNLFAYTGGSTLAAAAAGAEVVHVDAARNMVRRGQRNATLSALQDRPVRWIVEDATRFCQRELKRGRHYDGVILDPPSYGHGPRGEVWKLGQHLLPLLQLCGELTGPSPALLLLTCHTPGVGPAELSAYLSDGIFGACSRPPSTGNLALQTADGRKLAGGSYARWPD